MSHFWSAGLICLLSATSPLFAQDNPIEENAIFRQLVGSWEGNGTATGADGNLTQITEVWTGKLENGVCIISGTRTMGQNEHEFGWEFYANSGIVEGRFKMSQPEVDRRLEVSLDEAARTMKITVFLDGGSTLLVTNQMSEDGKSIQGTFEILNEAGQSTTTGSMTHTKSP